MLTSLLPRPFPRSLAARERDALCDLALTLGATAPTCCDDWTVKDLVVHLLVRERRPWSAAGGLLPALARTTARASAALADRDLASLVAQLRSVPLPLAVVDPIVNGMEMFVHHEDVRRARPDWTVRPLGDADERALWLSVLTLGRLQARRAGVGVVVESGSRRAVLGGGEAPVVVSGPVSEVLLLLCGRSEVDGLALDGPEDRVARLRGADLSI